MGAPHERYEHPDEPPEVAVRYDQTDADFEVDVDVYDEADDSMDNPDYLLDDAPEGQAPPPPPPAQPLPRSPWATVPSGAIVNLDSDELRTGLGLSTDRHAYAEPSASEHVAARPNQLFSEAELAEWSKWAEGGSQQDAPPAEVADALPETADQPVEEDIPQPVALAEGTLAVREVVEASELPVRVVERHTASDYYEGEVLMSRRRPTPLEENIASYDHVSIIGGQNREARDALLRAGVTTVVNDKLLDMPGPKPVALMLHYGAVRDTPMEGENLDQNWKYNTEMIDLQGADGLEQLVAALPVDRMVAVIAHAASRGDIQVGTAYEGLLGQLANTLQSHGMPVTPGMLRDGIRTWRTQRADHPLELPGWSVTRVKQVREGISKEDQMTSRQAIQAIGAWMDTTFRGDVEPIDLSQKGGMRKVPILDVASRGTLGAGSRRSALLTDTAVALVESGVVGVVGISGFDKAGKENPAGAESLLEVCRDRQVPIITTIEDLTEETVPLTRGSTRVVLQLTDEAAQVMSKARGTTEKVRVSETEDIHVNAGRSVHAGKSYNLDKNHDKPQGAGLSGSADMSDGESAGKSQSVSRALEARTSDQTFRERIAPDQAAILPAYDTGGQEFVYDLETGLPVRELEGPSNNPAALNADDAMNRISKELVNELKMRIMRRSQQPISPDRALDIAEAQLRGDEGQLPMPVLHNRQQELGGGEPPDVKGRLHRQGWREARQGTIYAGMGGRGRDPFSRAGNRDFQGAMLNHFLAGYRGSEEELEQRWEEWAYSEGVITSQEMRRRLRRRT